MGDDLPSGRQPPRFNLLESTMIPERRIDLNQKNGNADVRPDRQARDARERARRAGESHPDRSPSGHRPRQLPEGSADAACAKEYCGLVGRAFLAVPALRGASYLIFVELSTTRKRISINPTTRIASS